MIMRISVATPTAIPIQPSGLNPPDDDLLPVAPLGLTLEVSVEYSVTSSSDLGCEEVTVVAEEPEG